MVKKCMRWAATMTAAAAAILGLTGTAASAAPYTYGYCTAISTGSCTTSPAITASAAGRVIVTVISNNGYGTWTLLNSGSYVDSGSYSPGGTSTIVTGLASNGGSFTVRISPSVASPTGGYVCNFTTWVGGNDGPCML